MTPLQIKGSRGQLVDAKQLDFKIINERRSEYELSDGKILKIRVVIQEVYVTDEKDEITGKNGYFIKSMPIVSVEEPQK
jgi:hypothetical protein